MNAPLTCVLALSFIGGPLAAQNTSPGCVLQFTPNQIQATSLPTNVLQSGASPIPGQCSLVLSGQDLVFPAPLEAGSTKFSISVKRLELRQSRIITNGYRVSIRASEIISEDGQILSFLSRKAGPGNGAGQPGANGLSGGNLELVADVLRGTLVVDLRGQEGGDGAAGAAGPPGARGVAGSPGVSGVFGCQAGGGNRGPGATGGKGGRGGDGGRGGNGGSLVLSVGRVIQGKGVVANLEGGAGGQAGPGGPGGPPGAGGEGGSGSGFCRGGQPGPPGRQGPIGDPGTGGQKGVSGNQHVKVVVVG